MKHILILFLLVLAPICVHAQDTASIDIPLRDLLGGQLRNEAAPLLDEVEKLYGKPVLLNRIYGWPSFIPSSSSEFYGTPAIGINSDNKPEFADITPEITRELFRLKLRAEGYPAVKFTYKSDFLSDREREALETDINRLLLSAIEQELFYPAMREMGIDPPLLAGSMPADEPGLVDHPERVRILAANYFLACLELSDRQRYRDVFEQYERKDCFEAAKLGRQLAEIYHRQEPRTPKELISVYTKLLNHLYRGEARFSIKHWEKAKREGFLILPGVVLEAAPAY